MNVLVLGATSVIGSEIAAAFSPYNRVLLAGRDRRRLSRAADLCRQSGAAQVFEMPCDLSAGARDVARLAIESGVELVINAASATSRVRDEHVRPERMAEYLNVELLAPLDIIRSLAASRRDTPLRVIYLSTVLAVTRSPERTIYGALKAIHERALTVLAESSALVTVQIFRIATIINSDRRTNRATMLAKAVRHAFDEGRPMTTYGLAGRLMIALFFAQPLVYAGVTRAIRVVRRLRGPIHREGDGAPA